MLQVQLSEDTRSILKSVFRVLFFVVIVWITGANFLDMGSAVFYAESKGVPMPSLLVPVAQLALLAGGVLVAVGRKEGLIILLAFLFVVTLAMHQWWNIDPDDFLRVIEFKSFQLNCLLFVVTLGLFAHWD